MNSDSFKEGTVFIAEDDEDDFMLSGRFSAHWESSRGEDFEPGPEGVSAEEAIAWGRARADVVQIRTGEDDFYYTAGARQPRDEQPVWPEGGIALSRRRAPSMAFLDRTEQDPPIMWSVEISSDLPLAESEQARFIERFRELISADPKARDCSTHETDLDDDEPLLVHFLVQARTWEEANRSAGEVHQRAFHAAWSERGKYSAGQAANDEEQLFWVGTHVEPA